jgi:hypothetical protein
VRSVSRGRGAFWARCIAYFEIVDLTTRRCESTVMRAMQVRAYPSGVGASAQKVKV